MRGCITFSRKSDRLVCGGGLMPENDKDTL